MDCMIWNEAAIAKYVWNIAKKADNLWVKWVNQIYLKGRELWQYQPPTDNCWYRRKICVIKDKFALGYDGNRWVANKGEYTIQSGYQWRIGNDSQWPWWRETWNKMNIPKHSFICWIVMHQTLLTRDKPAKMGICQDKECLQCGSRPESINHLFFECKFSNECLKGVLE
ncbi:hypothetical protein KY285_036002 [Solanum tuberosum]|nr:hypothetical protein KY285_036002 [Solanum tuberosum]